VAKDAIGAVLEDRSWVYDGQLRVIAEINASGALRARYLYASSGHSPDVAVTFDPNTGEASGSYLLVHDQVGSVVRTVDLATGLAVEAVEYDPWGVATVSPGGTSVHPFGFAGGLWDRRTGLVRFGAREYDAGLGRWLARDPIGFAGGWNQYGYVGNLPADAVDPTGLVIVMVYNRESGLIYGFDFDTMGGFIVPAESGGKPIGAPIPPGPYEILRTPRPDFFRLDPLDAQPRNDRWDCSCDADGRDLFRLHKPGRTIGCVAVKGDRDWARLRNLLLNTGKQDAPVPTPWWKFWAPSAEPNQSHGWFFVP
jgi:RHS repeat-associated protein